MEKEKKSVYKRVKEYISNTPFTPKETFQTINEINAQEAIIDSQVGSVETNNVQWSEWIIINQWASYMANRFKFDTISWEWNIFIIDAIRAAFIYGNVCVYVENRVPYLAHIQEEKDGKSRIGIIPDLSKYYPSNSKDLKFLTVDSKKVIRYQFDALGFGAFLILKPIIKFEQHTQRAFMNELVALPTRVIHDMPVKGNNRIVQSFVKLLSPVLQRVHGGTEKFEKLALETNSVELTQLVEYVKNYYYDVLGRRTNTENKKAQLLKQEAEMGDSAFIILERERRVFLRSFLQKLSALLNTEIFLENEQGEMENVCA